MGEAGVMLGGRLMIGQYHPVDSLLHRLDPRVKVVSVVLFLGGLFVADNPPGYILLAGYMLCAAGLSKVPVKQLVCSLKPLWWIVLFTFGIHLFFTPGTTVWVWKSVTLTVEGIRQGVFTTLRLVLLILMSSLLTLTTSPICLTDGIERLLSPLQPIGVPAHEIAMMMTIALRFIPTLWEETDKIIKAQTARGADFSSHNPVVWAKNMFPIMVPMFISAFRRADELATAMESRCYRGGLGRTRMRELKAGRGDMAALAVAVGVIVGVVVLRNM